MHGRQVMDPLCRSYETRFLLLCNHPCLKEPQQIYQLTRHDANYLVVYLLNCNQLFVPEIYRNMWFIVHTVLNPIFLAIWQRQVSHAASIQIANYNLKDKQQGNWHHDESADISVVVPLNTGDYKGGGTEFHNYGTVDPLPSGHALIFPSFTHMHRGLPVESGDRYLLVFWLYSRSRVQDLYLDGPTILNPQG